MAGTTYSLVIAIETYNDPKDFGNISFAEKDADDIVNALVELGHDKDHIIVLKSGKATAQTIIQHLTKIADRCRENDRIIFYFTGHGLNIAGENLLVPADGMFDRAGATCVPVSTILNILNKSLSVQKMLFLDSCHSGFVPGEHVKDGMQVFRGDELEYQFRKAEYCIGFASCKSNQKSYTHPQLRNSVWTHFLVRALKGEAEAEVYEEGCLLAGKLQGYLGDHTYEYLQKNTDDKKVQTPIQFGAATGDFLIANLNRIFEKRAIAKAAEAVKLTSVSMYILEDGKIKDLNGFEKGKGHFIPSKIGDDYDKFVKKIGQNIIDEEINDLSESIQKGFKYTRKEITVDKGLGVGWIETPDFDYSIEVSQSPDDPSMYVVKRSIDSIKNPDMLNDATFNNIFDKYFDTLSFKFKKPINVIEWIDKLEEKGLEPSYDYENPKKCTFSLAESDTDIILTLESLDLFFTYSQSPHFLVEAYKETRYLLEMADIHLLN